jgi:hypothetical protein
MMRSGRRDGWGVEEEENGDADEAEREDAGWWSCLH